MFVLNCSRRCHANLPSPPVAHPPPPRSCPCIAAAFCRLNRLTGGGRVGDGGGGPRHDDRRAVPRDAVGDGRAVGSVRHEDWLVTAHRAAGWAGPSPPALADAVSSAGDPSSGGGRDRASSSDDADEDGFFEQPSADATTACSKLFVLRHAERAGCCPGFACGVPTSCKGRVDLDPAPIQTGGTGGRTAGVAGCQNGGGSSRGTPLLATESARAGAVGRSASPPAPGAIRPIAAVRPRWSGGASTSTDVWVVTRAAPSASSRSRNRQGPFAPAPRSPLPSPPFPRPLPQLTRTGTAVPAPPPPAPPPSLPLLRYGTSCGEPTATRVAVGCFVSPDVRGRGA